MPAVRWKIPTGRRILLLALGLALIVGVLVGTYFLYPWLRTRSGRLGRLWEWFRNPEAHPDWAIRAGERCGQAPFLMPSDGYIGFIWGDSFRPWHRHQGIDIFGAQEVGVTPVIAAYDGYLTRLPDWKSSLILRIPEDPLQPDRQIWLYYTHMADVQGKTLISEMFPPGVSEVSVAAGTFLGYQGNYSGDPLNPTGVHLHFSIVLDDGQGGFRNELEFINTLDPSPYLGLALNASQNRAGLSLCQQK